MDLPVIVLTKNKLRSIDCSSFGLAQNGNIANQKTSIALLFDSDNYLHIYFECFNNMYTAFNDMYSHNDPLYNQEVFEIFIGEGFEDCKNYLEVEINPNNAIWIGKIHNPNNSNIGIENTPITYENSGITHEVSIENNTWKGHLTIPMGLVSANEASEYRLNFFRIVATKQPNEKNWIGNESTCDYLCWSPSLSGENAAFHLPSKFGYLKIED